MNIRLESDTQSLVIASGRVLAPDAAADITFALGTGHFHAGLINAHDHLHRNHYPRLGRPPYEDAYEWGRHIHTEFGEEIAHAKRLPRTDALLFGALKNLVSGVTTVVHHDEWTPLFETDFPIRVARVRVVHSLLFDRDLSAAVRGTADNYRAPLCMHVAEGTNAESAREIAELAQRGLLDERLLAVHLVGVDSAGIAALSAARTAAVWCPTSNIFLFGRTAPGELFDCGIDILLGSDSLLTGAGTLLDELRVANSLGYLDAGRLLDAVGRTAATRLTLPLPSLDAGAQADFIFVRTPLLEANPADVALVIVGGRPVIADAGIAQLFELSGTPATRVDIGGVVKHVRADLATALDRARQLRPGCAPFLEPVSPEKPVPITD